MNTAVFHKPGDINYVAEEESTIELVKEYEYMKVLRKP